jgi:zinc protease
MKMINRKAFLSAALCLAIISNASAAIADHVVRSKVAGIDVIVYPMGVKDIVTLAGSLPAGDSYAEEGNISVASLTGMLLDKGTKSRDKFAIAKQLDDVGAQVSFNVGEQMVAIGGKSLKKDLPLLIRILAEELRTPAFSAEELEKAKKQFEGTLRPALENTKFRAQDAYSRLVYPAGHPNRMHEIPEWLSASEQLKLDEVKAFHQKYYGPAHLTLIFVGDVDAKRIQAEIGKAFGGWTGGVDVIRSSQTEPVRAQREQRIELKDKTSVSVILGQPTGLRYLDPDSVPLRVGTAILGSGFTGRLMSTIRDKEGLTYGIGASVGGDTFVDGSWTVSAAFAPALLDKGIASTRRELDKWWQNGVTPAELAARKTNLIGTYQVGLATTEGMAGAMLQTLHRGKPLSWLDDYPSVIQALTVEQINSAIKKHLDPQKMVRVEAGTFETAAQPPAP